MSSDAAETVLELLKNLQSKLCACKQFLELENRRRNSRSFWKGEKGIRETWLARLKRRGDSSCGAHTD
jgi:hypothetical protein